MNQYFLLLRQMTLASQKNESKTLEMLSLLEQTSCLPPSYPEEESSKFAFECSEQNCHEIFKTAAEYEEHVITLHQLYCTKCQKCFPNSFLYSTHTLEAHDTYFQILAQKQKSFPCLVEECPKKFQTDSARTAHLVKVHSFPKEFRFHSQRWRDTFESLPGSSSLEERKNH
eukprot:GCRY01001803.1.p1 GENE.GCRY01001803.1~~GCRY01001803.1.p1  ORF type:complete len:171 (+),score=0.90 GCRY01001803.1:241-753(+)